mmetsp:Transcript_109785/g.316081  ORF Transcript_109785/g.316081 Transcript_109785/m.316081 type:complete len:228 (-) Transcript_109785:1779-2462(-)
MVNKSSEPRSTIVECSVTAMNAPGLFTSFAKGPKSSKFTAIVGKPIFSAQAPAWSKSRMSMRTTNARLRPTTTLFLAFVKYSGKKVNTNAGSLSPSARKCFVNDWRSWLPRPRHAPFNSSTLSGVARMRQASRANARSSSSSMASPMVSTREQMKVQYIATGGALVTSRRTFKANNTDQDMFLSMNSELPGASAPRIPHINAKCAKSENLKTRSPCTRARLCNSEIW